MHVARHSLGEPAPTVIGSNVTIGEAVPTRKQGETMGCPDVYVAGVRQQRNATAQICGLVVTACALSAAGHGATIHACTIEDDSLVGMGATVLDGAKVTSTESD